MKVAFSLTFMDFSNPCSDCTEIVNKHTIFHMILEKPDMHLCYWLNPQGRLRIYLVCMHNYIHKIAYISKKNWYNSSIQHTSVNYSTHMNCVVND